MRNMSYVCVRSGQHHAEEVQQFKAQKKVDVHTAEILQEKHCGEEEVQTS